MWKSHVYILLYIYIYILYIHIYIYNINHLLDSKNCNYVCVHTVGTKKKRKEKKKLHAVSCTVAILQYCKNVIFMTKSQAFGGTGDLRGPLGRLAR